MSSIACIDSRIRPDLQHIPIYFTSNLYNHLFSMILFIYYSQNGNKFMNDNIFIQRAGFMFEWF